MNDIVPAGAAPERVAHYDNLRVEIYPNRQLLGEVAARAVAGRMRDLLAR